QVLAVELAALGNDDLNVGFEIAQTHPRDGLSLFVQTALIVSQGFKQILQTSIEVLVALPVVLRSEQREIFAQAQRPRVRTGNLATRNQELSELIELLANEIGTNESRNSPQIALCA